MTNNLFLFPIIVCFSKKNTIILVRAKQFRAIEKI